MSDVEATIQAKGLTAPRVTQEDVEANVLTEQYQVFPGTTVTVCVLTARNGYAAVGHSACASPENFDAELGQQIARRNAISDLWGVMGYALMERLSAG